ncbi:MAG: DUF3108 domain-containing protein [Syntrophales bacterium]
MRKRFLKKLPTSRQVCFTLFLLLPFILIIYSENLVASELKFPFEVGEKLVYRATLGLFTVGDATIKVLPGDGLMGTKSYHFVMQTNTNSLVNWFYRVHETQESYTDWNMSRTLAYEKRDTGTHPRDISARFDWNRLTATYVNEGKDEKTVAIIPGTFDPLALFFVIRTKTLLVGDIIEIPFTDGKKLIQARASVLRRERITIDGKSYDTFLVVPDLKQLGEAMDTKKTADLMIWFGADEKKMPIKISSQLAVGRFVLELVP